MQVLVRVTVLMATVGISVIVSYKRQLSISQIS